MTRLDLSPKLQRASVTLALVFAVLLGAASCSELGPTAPERDLAPFEIVAPDGARAVMRIVPANPDTLALVSVEYPAAPPETDLVPTGSLNPEVPPQGALAPALIWTARALTAVGIFTAVRDCVTTARNNGVNWQTAERCTWEAAGVIANAAAGAKLVPAVKVVPLRHAVHKVLLRSITHQRLTAIFNKGTKPTFQAAVNLLADIVYGELIDKLVNTVLEHR